MVEVLADALPCGIAQRRCHRSPQTRDHDSPTLLRQPLRVPPPRGCTANIANTAMSSPLPLRLPPTLDLISTPFRVKMNQLLPQLLQPVQLVLTGNIPTMCYLPAQNTPERECWYINMGAVDKNFCTVQAMTQAAPWGKLPGSG